MDAEEWVRLVAAALASGSGGAGGGDERAQAKLVKALTPVIQARVARTLLSRRWALGGRDIRQEVEDLTQKVFLSLFARDGRVLRSWKAERGLSFENFVGLVAERRARSFLRKRNPWKEELATDEEPDVPDEGADPERDVASRQQLRLLLDLLRDRLSPLGWHLFVLIFVQELSVHEVIVATGLSAAAVYKWTSRLRSLARELRGELSKSGSSPRRPGEDDENDEDDPPDEDDEE